MEWTEPQDAGGVDSALDVHGVDRTPGRKWCRQCSGCAQSGWYPWMHTVWTVPLDVSSVDGAPGCEQGGRSPQDTHGVDGTPGCEQGGWSPRTHMAWTAPLDVSGVDGAPGA